MLEVGDEPEGPKDISEQSGLIPAAENSPDNFGDETGEVNNPEEYVENPVADAGVEAESLEEQEEGELVIHTDVEQVESAAESPPEDVARNDQVAEAEGEQVGNEAIENVLTEGVQEGEMHLENDAEGAVDDQQSYAEEHHEIDASEVAEEEHCVEGDVDHVEDEGSTEADPTKSTANEEFVTQDGTLDERGGGEAPVLETNVEGRKVCQNIVSEETKEVAIDVVKENENQTAVVVSNSNYEGDPEANGIEEAETQDDSHLEHEPMDVADETNDGELMIEEGMNGDAAEEDEMKLNEDDLEANSVSSNTKALPQCRLKRNYCCLHCGFNTQNPREHLYHLRDEHGERMKVFECPRCIYASKNQQKLIRHARMVHKLKIKAKDSNNSPSKKRSKSPRAKVSPSKSSRASVSPGKSSRSSPGKSPRSYEGDTFDDEDDDDDDDMEDDESPSKDGEKKQYGCEQCEYTCHSRKLLNRHETSFHLKRRFFRCVKCNYVTHLKGRYTKHMKYHQLPILKCEYCDFRTPYRWNLDRHMKNHTEDCGEYKCHLCNFTAQIKQSLTVHISNHHLTPSQIREREMKRTIGISDPADCNSDDQEMEMLRLERDEHPDALRLGLDYPDSPTAQDAHHNGNSFRVSNIDMGGTEDSQVNADDSKDEDGAPKPKKPKIKITLKKMKEPKQQKDTFFQELNERHNFEEDFIHPDDVVHRHGNVYIKTFKCHVCTFKAAFENEVTRHEKKVHGIQIFKTEAHSTKKSKKFSKSSRSPRERPDTLQQILQYPQSLGLMEESETKPRRESMERQSPSDRRELDYRERGSLRNNSNSNEQGGSNQKSGDDSCDSHTASSKESSPSKDVGKKKNSSSFFDKLQEKISTSNVQNLVCQFCGHESKCLSESVRHQKLHLSAKNIYASASLSTRCQFCRHRCKTTDDLVNHLKLCPEARKNQIMDSGKRVSGGRQEGEDDTNESCQDDYADDNTPENEESANEDSKDEALPETPEDDKHPMENRVFVWNKFRSREEGGGEQAGSESKGKVEDEDSDKEDRDSKSDILEAPSKESSSSPVMMDYVLDYIESTIPQGPHCYSKRVFRCPQCSFWATTASRFHVHIVGHFNKKPYNCSECGYKSNWRWDITKHIKLKMTRDNSHQNADVVITDATGEKNYEKYDRYLTVIQLDEANAHRTEGGIPNRKGRPKRTPEKDEEPESVVTPTTSPIRKPPMVTIPVVPRLQGLPRLSRAPVTTSTSTSTSTSTATSTSTSRPGPSPGPMPFGPILPGPQMMVQIATSCAASAATTTSSSSPRLPPPPLCLRAPMPIKGSQVTTTAPLNAKGKTAEQEEKPSTTPTPPTTTAAQYQIITAQGAVNTSLETLQLLASGSTNLSKLKRLQKNCVVRAEQKESQNPNSHQVSVSSTGEDGREVAKMVLDHEGNPEWKCNTCDFRDSERETVVQHVRLAHARGGPVSLLHAVHRCDVCGYAAGTKRAVQLHIDSSHGGHGGITSRCEGQTPDPKDHAGDGESSDHQESSRTIKCRICPYSCKKRSEMRAHIVYHTPRADCIFKCMFCPYYVPSKMELFEHLSLHGMKVPPSMLEAVSKSSGSNSSSPAPTSQDDGSRQFLCGACPFETRSRSKLMHHRQFHKPKGLPFKCPHCTYNVTRRHLLSQHIRVHGVDPGPDDGLEANDGTADDRSNSPSPSLTITPVNNVAVGVDRGQDSTFTDTSVLPKLTDQATMLLEDIPLVWVSRDNSFFKMFKCRHCPHVNLRKTNIQEHEKMHKPDAARESGGLHCPHCSYISVNAGVMSAHLKVHGGSMGQCHAVVDSALTDENQLRLLTSKVPPPPSPPSLPVSTTAIKTEVQPTKGDEKLLYFCQQCPARFFFEKEIQIHTRFHLATLPHHCDHCSFGARQEAHLLTHVKVHSAEYQQRTGTMMGHHRAAPSHPPVPGLSLSVEQLGEITTDCRPAGKDDEKKRTSVSSTPSPGAMPQPPPTSRYLCDRCPASFSKLLTLQYHQSLHGANNPHHCQRCSYAGKTADNLKQHQQLHDQFDENVRAENAAKETAEKEVQAKAEAVNAAAAASAAATAAAAASAAAAAAAANVKPSVAVPERAESYRIEYPTKPQKHPKYEKDGTVHHPPIKLKLIGLRPVPSENGSGGRPQFKYYVEEQVPISGVDLLRRKTEMEKEGQRKGETEATSSGKSKSKSSTKEKDSAEVETDPMRIGDRTLHYPLHIDKVTGKSREKRYKCNKCPSAFEKMEQYHVHSNLHGCNHKYKCQICDYSVKFYANFRMHINRHKYHEKLVSQKLGTVHPTDDDPKYLPAITSANNSGEGKGSKHKLEDKENVDDRDLTTTERQHLLLQNKKGVDISKRDADRERQVYYCLYCPYANVRRDAVDSHSYRHLANGGYGVYKCTLCDYTASQLNFIKEHTKVHFRPFKYVSPEGFMRHDRHDILCTPIVTPAAKQKAGESISASKEKQLVFSHNSGVYKPEGLVDGVNDIADPKVVGAIKVNYRSGDVVDAPDDFVVALRPTKTKSGHKLPEYGDSVVSNTESKVNVDELAASECMKESTKTLDCEKKSELSETEGTKEALANPDAMEVETTSVHKKSQIEEAVLTNGHVASEESEMVLNGSAIGNVESATGLEGDMMEVDVETVENLPPKIPVTKAWVSEQPESLVSSL